MALLLTCLTLLASWFIKILSPSIGWDNIPATHAPLAGVHFAAMQKLPLLVRKYPRNLWLVVLEETLIKLLSTPSVILEQVVTWFGTPVLIMVSSMAQMLMLEVAMLTGHATQESKTIPIKSLIITLPTITEFKNQKHSLNK